MKKQFYSFGSATLSFLFALLLTMTFFGCGDDDDAQQVDQDPGNQVDQGTGNGGESNDFAMITSTLNEDGQTRAFFLQRVSVDSASGAIDNSKATELSPRTGAMVHAYKGSIFFSDYNNGQMVKWDIDKQNNASKSGEMSLSELGFQGNAAFKNETTAFVGGLNTSIVIFNPSTMTKTGTIDFKALSKVGQDTDVPTEGRKYQGESVSEIIIRDNFLFASLMPLSDVAKFQPAEIGCSIIVIDLDKVDVDAVGNTDAVVKRIYDERGSSTGAWGSGGGNPFMQIDEKNDIYVLCHNFWANPFLRSNFKPSCILKIANDQTEFDKDYYFNVEAASRGEGNGVMNFEYYGNGKFLAAVQDVGAIDSENPISYFVDPVFQWFSFDLYNKTAQKVTEEYTRGALAAVSYFEDDNGYIPFENKGENYVMKVNLSTLKTEKHFTTVGLPQLYSLK